MNEKYFYSYFDFEVKMCIRFKNTKEHFEFIEKQKDSISLRAGEKKKKKS